MNIKPDTTKDARMRRFTAGRTIEEQIEDIRKTGMHCITPVIRTELLRALGVPKPKPTAENLIKFGCYMPFFHPRYVQGYFELLHLLGVDYTYLEKEYCCGGTAVQISQGKEREKAIEAGKEFMQMNRAMAREKGAKTIAYVCVCCAHFAKVFFPDEADRHVYLWDLIADKLAEKTLRIEPTTAGYFGGCGGSRYRAIFPQVKLDWKVYRDMMNRVEGLKLVDLGKGVCCKMGAEPVVEEATRLHLDTVITPCNGCYAQVKETANGRVQVKYLSDILLLALEGNNGGNH